MKYRAEGRFEVLADVDLGSGAVSLRLPEEDLARLRAHVANQ